MFHLDGLAIGEPDRGSHANSEVHTGLDDVGSASTNACRFRSKHGRPFQDLPSEEAGCSEGGGGREEVPRWPLLFHASVLHEYDAMGDAGSFVLIVGDENSGDAELS